MLPEIIEHKQFKCLDYKAKSHAQYYQDTHNMSTILFSSFFLLALYNYY